MSHPSISDPPVLRVITPDATPEEVAAILAAVTASLPAAAAAVDGAPAEGLDDWVHASRLAARRGGLSRGSWRLSGRVSRRTRPR